MPFGLHQVEEQFARRAVLCQAKNLSTFEILTMENRYLQMKHGKDTSHCLKKFNVTHDNTNALIHKKRNQFTELNEPGFSSVQFILQVLILFDKSLEFILKSVLTPEQTNRVQKIQQNIVDMLFAPLSALEVSLAIIFAAVTRSLLIGFISVIVFSLIVEVKIFDFLYILYASFFGSFILGSLGFVTGLWAEKFDHTATITNFIITPLSFLSGVFYSIEKLPEIFQSISQINPFFHIINIFRYGFLGQSDGSMDFGIIYLPVLAFAIWLLAFYLYKIGYKIKS